VTPIQISKVIPVVFMFNAAISLFNSVEVERIRGDEENILQSVAPNSQEAVVSCLSLHWVNDLPGKKRHCTADIHRIEILKVHLSKYVRRCNRTGYFWGRCLEETRYSN